ncbi:MAG: DegT/DnrJ/EryC1/StrS family aminotransferase [Thermoguttaceae bacterium]
MASILSRGIRKIQRIVSRRLKPSRGALKAAVIGCGKISADHIGGYEGTTDALTVAVSDISAAALASTLDQWTFLRAFRDYPQMLREAKPDVVSVCTWPQLHAEIVCAAARAGVKGILCEKPLALSLAEIEQMADACRASGTKLACGHQYRFHPVFIEAADYLRSGKLGQVSKARGVIRGSIANNGPHLIDTLRFVLGDPRAVRVTSQGRREHDTVERGLPCEESALSTIEFDGGVVGEIETGHPDPRAFRIEVEGTGGSLTVAPGTLVIRGEKKVFDVEQVTADCRLRQFREFVRWANGKQPTYAATYEPASATAELVLAIYESIRVKGPVGLPLQNKGDVIRQTYPTPVVETDGAHVAPTMDSESNAVSPAGDRLAIAGGDRAVQRWFSSAPVFGLTEVKNLASVLLSRNLSRVGGRMVPELERQVARLYGAANAVASTSGTTAIHVAIGAIDPEPCDEIITTPISDMGTVIPILASNCIPVFADVDPETGNLTAETIAAKITPKTRAAIVVHLFGRPAAMPPIVALLRERGIALIEDCAQAHLAEYDGKMVGTFGDFGCFSLQQSKQITCGDGGLTLINRPELAERAQLFADKGWARGGGRNHQFLGWNYRMTELQGAVALAQLGRLPELIRARRSAADQLTKLLSEIEGVVLPPRDSHLSSSWWKYPFGVRENATALCSDEVFDALRVEGVRMMRQYLPRPLFEEPMLRCPRTYGQSGYPFSATRYTRPNIEDFPGLQAFNKRWFLMEWSNRVKPRHVIAIHRAVEKVIARTRRCAPSTAQKDLAGCVQG